MPGGETFAKGAGGSEDLHFFEDEVNEDIEIKKSSHP